MKDIDIDTEIKHGISNEKYLENMLCQSCKFLTREQMIGIFGDSAKFCLFEWYVNYLSIAYNSINGFYGNDAKCVEIIKEGERIGVEFPILEGDCGYDSQISNMKATNHSIHFG